MSVSCATIRAPSSLPERATTAGPADQQGVQGAFNWKVGARFPSFVALDTPQLPLPFTLFSLIPRPQYSVLTRSRHLEVVACCLGLSYFSNYSLNRTLETEREILLVVLPSITLRDFLFVSRRSLRLLFSDPLDFSAAPVCVSLLADFPLGFICVRRYNG